MMTQAQILTFTIIARCCYARYSAMVVGCAIIGDPAFAYHRQRLIIANMILKRLKCYNPDAEDNCIEWTEMYSLMQILMQILGMCGDLYALESSDTTCCATDAGITILNS